MLSDCQNELRTLSKLLSDYFWSISVARHNKWLKNDIFWIILCKMIMTLRKKQKGVVNLMKKPKRGCNSNEKSKEGIGRSGGFMWSVDGFRLADLDRIWSAVQGPWPKQSPKNRICRDLSCVCNVRGPELAHAAASD